MTRLLKVIGKSSWFLSTKRVVLITGAFPSSGQPARSHAGQSLSPSPPQGVSIMGVDVQISCSPSRWWWEGIRVQVSCLLVHCKVYDSVNQVSPSGPGRTTFTQKPLGPFMWPLYPGLRSHSSGHEHWLSGRCSSIGNKSQADVLFTELYLWDGLPCRPATAEAFCRRDWQKNSDKRRNELAAMQTMCVTSMAYSTSGAAGCNWYKPDIQLWEWLLG